MKKVQIKLIGLAIFLALAGAAWGADCGDGVAACSCGDTVVVSSVLDGSDPVCTTNPSESCSGVGLFVNGNNITLDLGGCTIQGAPGSTIGIHATGDGIVIKTGRILSFSGPAQDPAVLLIGNNGRISNLQIFDTAIGVRVEGDSNTLESLLVRPMSPNEGVFVMGTKNVVSRVNVSLADDGIFCRGNSNIVEKSTSARNRGDGISCRGDSHIIRLNRAEGNGGSGIFMSLGDGQQVLRNIALRNTVDGVDVGGDNAIVERNQAKYNGDSGFSLTGSGQTVSLNIAASNGDVTTMSGNGFSVGTTGSVFDRNRSTFNAVFGIEDTGQPGAKNKYTGNICDGNFQGDQSPFPPPPVLCR